MFKIDHLDKVNFTQGVNQDNKGEILESVNVLPDEVITPLGYDSNSNTS